MAEKSVNINIIKVFCLTKLGIKHTGSNKILNIHVHVYKYVLYMNIDCCLSNQKRGRRGRNCMVVVNPTTCAISAYHH